MIEFLTNIAGGVITNVISDLLLGKKKQVTLSEIRGQVEVLLKESEYRQQSHIENAMSQINSRLDNLEGIISHNGNISLSESSNQRNSLRHYINDLNNNEIENLGISDTPKDILDEISKIK